MKKRHLLFVSTLLLINHILTAQSVSLSIGWYHNINRAEPTGQSLWESAYLSQRPLGSIEVYFSDLINNPEKFHRSGLRIQGFSINSKPVYPSKVSYASQDGTRYGMFVILWNFQRKVIYRDRSFGMLAVAPGLAFFSDDNDKYSDTIFVNLPNVKFAFNGGFDYYYKIDEKSAFRIAIKYTQVFSDNIDTYPFSSGPSIEAGFIFGKL